MAKDTYVELGVQADFKEIVEMGSRGCSWLAAVGAIAVEACGGLGLSVAGMGLCWCFLPLNGVCFPSFGN